MESKKVRSNFFDFFNVLTSFILLFLLNFKSEKRALISQDFFLKNADKKGEIIVATILKNKIRKIVKSPLVGHTYFYQKNGKGERIRGGARKTRRGKKQRRNTKKLQKRVWKAIEKQASKKERKT